MNTAIPKLLIIIPARGGSKGLPGKNVKILGDIPLLGWTAEAIKHARLPNATTILSTDDPEIAHIGTKFGLTIPFTRPAELATDNATAVDVALHALQWHESEYGSTPEIIMLLQPTSPFRPPEVISNAIHFLDDSTVDAVVGVKPIYRTMQTLFQINRQQHLTPLEHNTEIKTRRQDVRPIYTPNGAMYLIRSDVLIKNKSFFPDRMREIVVDQICGHDIDTPIDWAVAKAFVAAKLTWRS